MAVWRILLGLAVYLNSIVYAYTHRLNSTVYAYTITLLSKSKRDFLENIIKYQVCLKSKTADSFYSYKGGLKKF